MQANTVSTAIAGLGAMAVSVTALAMCAPNASKTALNKCATEKTQLTVLTLDESIDAVIQRPYHRGIPYAQIRCFGPAALPRLRAMLSDTAEKEYWSNATGAIGIIGGPIASDALIGYINANRDRALEPEGYRAVLTAVLALGYVANDGDTRAMSFIIDAARHTNDPSPHTESLRLSPSVIGVQAILALGLSGRLEARGVLEEMQRSGDDTMRERTAEALRTLEHVAKVGLASYFKRD